MPVENSVKFERSIRELSRRIRAIKEVSQKESVGKIGRSVQLLEEEARRLELDYFSTMDRWKKVELSRHDERPQMLDYLMLAFDDFIELRGDRLFGDDPAVVGGLARFRNKRVMVIGNQKGRGLKERIDRNFGMPHPEGYRKAQRLMLMAERFGLPLITLVDTPGAYPGVEAEERGQSEAIARSMYILSRLAIPIVAVVIGEGGSGGALALAVADRVLMMEHANFSVVSPEACASILWKDRKMKREAAEALKSTAQDNLAFGLIDEVIAEPLGGAHRDHAAAAKNLAEAVDRHLLELIEVPVDRLLTERYEKTRKIGVFSAGEDK
jgi:acetyl-CoA carboxylase carboxyl transferase subunit alpha